MRAYFLNLPVDCGALRDVLEFLEERLKTGKRTRIVTLNPEIAMAAQHSPALRKAIREADLVVPDGVGITLFLRLIGYRTERIPGIDLSYLLMTNLSKTGGRVFLLGGAPGVSVRAGERLKREFPDLQVVGTTDGFFSSRDEMSVVARIIAARPNLLIVGLGTPRQELWLERYWDDLEVPLGIGVGGSIDIWAGGIPRAPKVMRKVGLEWLYRAWVQPWRWRRVLKLFRFMAGTAFNFRRKRVKSDE
jgi:N-acetylglucosaminyldiphosphoundecaprenol N-acetyl-beta-D-mannosaminyltransferase